MRERLGDPRVVPGFHCSILPDMPPSLTPGSSIVVPVQNIDVDIGLAPVGALELMSMGVALVLDQSQLADPGIGLAQAHAEPF